MRPSIELPQLDASHGRGSFDLSRFDQIRVASPCSMRWDDMSGDARARFCGSCKLNVYDISAMTKQEAAALIAEKEGHLCVRFFRRADGTILTKNCPVGLRRVRHAIVRLAGSLAAVAVLGVGAVAAMGERIRGRSVRVCQTEPYVTLTKLLRTPPTAPPPPMMGVMMMGEIAYTPGPPANQAGSPAGSDGASKGVDGSGQ